MRWKALTVRDAVDPGTVIQIDRGYSDAPPRTGEEIQIVNGSSGRSVVVTVVSSSGDRLEVSDGTTLTTLRLASGERAATLDADGRYFESWLVD